MDTPETGSDRLTAVASSWFVVDHDTDRVIRGPYATAEIAGAVRTEMERDGLRDSTNLWIEWR